MSAIFLIIFTSVILIVLRLTRIPRWTPIYIFVLFWWLQYVVCYILFQKTNWSYICVFYLSGCEFAAILGYKLLKTKSYIKEEKDSINIMSSYNVYGARKTIIAFIILGLIYSSLSLVRNGFSLRSFLNVDTLLEMNNSMAISRYGGNNGNSSIFNQLLLSFVYVAPLSGGAFFPFARTKNDRILCLITFIPDLLVLFSSNLKAGFIACIIFWIAGYLVSKTRIYGTIRLSGKSIRIAIIVIGISVLIMFATMVLRTGTISVRTIQITQRKLINYVFGHVAAFDNWLYTNYKDLPYTLGYQTFIGISRYINFGTRIQGVYQDIYHGAELSTNVFSYFRGIAQDYGIIGSFVFFFIVGVISASSNRTITKNKKNTSLAETLLALQYSFLLYFAVSIYSYASFILVFIIFYFFVSITNKSSKSEGHIKFVFRKSVRA